MWLTTANAEINQTNMSDYNGLETFILLTYPPPLLNAIPGISQYKFRFCQESTWCSDVVQRTTHYLCRVMTLSNALSLLQSHFSNNCRHAPDSTAAVESHIGRAHYFLSYTQCVPKRSVALWSFTLRKTLVPARKSLIQPIIIIAKQPRYEAVSNTWLFSVFFS